MQTLTGDWNKSAGLLDHPWLPPRRLAISVSVSRQVLTWLARGPGRAEG